MFRGDPERPLEYEGPRDEAGIVHYLKKQAGCCACCLLLDACDT